MIPWWALALLIFGVNFLVWGTISVTRLVDQVIVYWRRGRRRRRYPQNVLALSLDPAGRRAHQVDLTVDDVAVLIPAHNEAAVLADSIDAITKLVPRKNVHVVSDGSTDDTFGIALRCGVKAIQTRRNVGKAGALRDAIERFQLVERFPVVMLLDADTRVQPGYFAAALPLFNSPRVVAVAGCVRTETKRVLSPVGSLLVGHRMRIYAMGQRVLKYGQTSRYLNATPIVPGFASIYRTAVLPDIDINPVGLAIEDFNMTFEVYHNNLGKVGFTLGAVAVTQDPDNFHDYIRQTRRWALGMWQTVRRHPPRFNLFTAMLALSLTELITASLMFLVLPLIVLILALPDFVSSAVAWPGYGSVYAVIASHMNLLRVFYGVIVPDLAMTVLVAIIERRPRLLLAAPFFPFMRVLDSALGLWAIPLAWLANSNGVWKSPTRRGVPQPGRHQAPVEPVPVADIPEVAAAAYAPTPVEVAFEEAAAFAEAEGHHASG